MLYIDHNPEAPAPDLGRWTLAHVGMRTAAYSARRAIRSGNVDGYLRRNKSLDTPTVRRLAEVLAPLLVVHCIAKAESLAIDIVIKEMQNG